MGAAGDDGDADDEDDDDDDEEEDDYIWLLGQTAGNPWLLDGSRRSFSPSSLLLNVVSDGSLKRSKTSC